MSAKPYFALLRRPLALWLAVLIAVFGALAPTLSHALTRARGDALPLAAVCRSPGPRGVVASPLPADSPNGQESAPALVHCPFCLFGTDRAAPAPNALLHLAVVPGEFGVPTIWQVFLFSPHFALTPPPRGPPTFS